MSQKPYTFDIERPWTWDNFPAPYLAPRFREELAYIGGSNLYGEPNLIFEWGSTALEEIDGKPGIKYYFRTVRKPGGTKLINGIIVPYTVEQDIGIPRWFVSRWMPPHKDFPRGRYVFHMRIEDAEGGYQPIDEQQMERIRQFWIYTLNRPDGMTAEEIIAAGESPAFIN